MLGWTQKINWNYWRRLKLLAFALVSAAVFAGAASAKPDGATEKASQSAEIPYLSHGIGISAPVEETAGGVTPTNLARAYAPQNKGAVVQQAAGGVTPTNLARAYMSQYKGVAVPDGFQQPQLRADERALIRDVPDGLRSEVRRAGSGTVYVANDRRSFELGDAALGFGLGLLIATCGAIAIVLTRRNMRMAHS
jgi:hypothetical protein